MGLMESRREIINNEPSVQEVEGNAYKFETDVKGKLNDFKLEFMAQQEGSGTPSENNVRTIVPCSSLTYYQGGRSVVPFKTNSYTSTSKITNGFDNFTPELDPNLFPNNIWLAYSADIDNTNNLEDEADPSYVSIWAHKNNGGYSFGSDTVQIPHHQTGRSYTYIILNAKQHDWVGFGYTLRRNSTISNPMVEIGLAQHDYEPYNVNSHEYIFPPIGKNIFDINKYPLTSGWIHGGAGSWSDSNTYDCIYDFMPVEQYAGQTLTLNKAPGGNNPGIAFYTEADTNTFISGVKNLEGAANIPITATIPNNAKYMRFTVPAGATDIQIELGSSSTAYEPFNNQYGGGYIEPLTGNFVETHRYATITDVIGKQSGHWYSSASTLSLPDIYALNSDLTTDRFEVITSVDGSETNNSMTFYANGDIGWKEQSSMTSDEYKAYLAEHPIQILYKLKTPIVHKVPIIVPKQLKGANSFWSNDGQVNVKYYKH